MAAPVRAATTTTKGTAANAATLNLPATIAAGDRLIAFVYVDDEDATITNDPQDSTSDAWTTDLASRSPVSANSYTMAIFSKIADGDEGGGTLNVVHNAGTEDFLGFVVRCTGAHATQALELSTIVDDADGDPDPASLTASWGAEDNLFITYLAQGRINTVAAPTPPTGYTFSDVQGEDWDVTTANVASGAVGAIADKQVTATATEDPGPWAWENFITSAVTVVVRPAEVGNEVSVTLTASAEHTEAVTAAEIIIAEHTGTGVISGSVVLDADSTPVESALVVAVRQSSGEVEVTGQTDVNGDFALAAVEPGLFDVYVRRTDSLEALAQTTVTVD